MLSTKLRTGIVGMPNVGKSTLFNALVGQSVAAAANYPFCTIDPNIGVVNVPDARLDVLAKINKSVSVLPVAMEFVDIAGIVKGASEGAGLGNKFLSNIRQTDAIIHAVRCFENEDIIHVDGSVDPIRDIEVINIELALTDMNQIEKRLEKCKKDKFKTNTALETSALEKIHKSLSDNVAARFVDLSHEEKAAVNPLMLLTMKPMMYAMNVNDSDLATGNAMTKEVREYIGSDSSVIVSAQVEAELGELGAEDRMDFLQSLGIQNEDDCGLRLLIKNAYETLGLQTYFTAGPTETRAWTIRKGTTAPQAAGVIHSDFERGFIRAEIMNYHDLVVTAGGSEARMKELGLIKSEGKDYVMQEGDIALFRFNV